MFRKNSSSSGKQDGSKVTKTVSFAYDIPLEDIDRNSDWGKPNFDNANKYSTQLRFKQVRDKFHNVLYVIIGILLLVCMVMTFMLVFNTEYEIAYVDDGTTLMCRVK